MTDLTLPRDLHQTQAASPLPRRGGRLMGAIGSFVVRRARLVLIVTMLAVIGFGVLGFGAFGKLKTGGFQDPAAESTTAQTLTDQRFGGADGVVLLVHAKAGTVDDAPARAAGAEAAGRLTAVQGVSNVVSYWSTRNPGLKSKDGTYALVVGSTKSDRDLSASELAGLRSRNTQVDVTVGGDAAISNDITEQVGKSLAHRRVDRRADHPGAAGVRVRQRRRRAAAAGDRGDRDPRHVRRAVRARLGDRRGDLRDQPDHRARPGAGHRLRAADGQPLPRGARGAGASRRRRSCAACRRPGARSCSAARRSWPRSPCC